MAALCITGDEAIHRMIGMLPDIRMDNDSTAEATSPAGSSRGKEGDFPSSYELVLMDLNMPVKDGWQATRELRDRGFTGVVVALTGNATEEARKRCTECGFSAFMSKPCKKLELQHLLDAVKRQSVQKAS